MTVEISVIDNEATLSCEYPGGTFSKKYEAEEEECDTRNRLALKALILALEHMTRPCHIVISCNNIYVTGALAQKWPEKWSRAEWKRSNGYEVANRSEWTYLMELLGKQQSYEVKEESNE